MFISRIVFLKYNSWCCLTFNVLVCILQYNHMYATSLSYIPCYCHFNTLSSTIHTENIISKGIYDCVQIDLVYIQEYTIPKTLNK